MFRRLIFSFLCLCLVRVVSAEVVVFQSDKTLRVENYSIEGAVIHLTLNENSEMSIPLEWIREIRPSPPEPEPQPIQFVQQRSDEDVDWEFAYSDLVLPLARKHEVDWKLVTAVMAVESNFNPYAISPKGARGLMQLMPGTATLYRTSDVFDPMQNLEAGVQHLKMLMERYKGDLNLVVAAYNAGEKAVDRYRGIPPYRETQDYVKKVLKLYQTLST